MDLPFTLTERRDGSLLYGIALWYRIFAACIFGILSWTLATQGQPPTFVGWVLLVLSALGAMYEERWTFGRAGAVHAVGLVFAARRTSFSPEDLAALRVVPHVRGTVPGSEDEARENARALSGEEDAGIPGRKFLSWKKSYLLLVLRTRDGAEYAVDKVPARRREYLYGIARRVSDASGIPTESA